MSWHETCACKSRLNASVCNAKCRCECKELIDKGSWDDGFISNHSACKCEYHKSCDIGQYLD